MTSLLMMVSRFIRNECQSTGLGVMAVFAQHRHLVPKHTHDLQFLGHQIDDRSIKMLFVLQADDDSPLSRRLPPRETRSRTLTSGYSYWSLSATSS